MTGLRQQLVEYLRQTFGKELCPLLNEPEGVQVGERVLYTLKPNREARRREPSDADLDALRQTMTDIARTTGATGISVEPPVTSGLPYPRLIDLPGSSIIWDRDLRSYMDADVMLPSTDFPLEWAVGVLHTPSQTMLLYLDFTDSVVKAVFRVFFDTEGYSSRETATVLVRFKQFQTKKKELLAECARRPHVAWAKLVQVDDEPLWVRIMEVAGP